MRQPDYYDIPFLGGPLDGELLQVPLGLNLPMELTASNEVGETVEGHYTLCAEQEESAYFETDPMKYVWSSGQA